MLVMNPSLVHYRKHNLLTQGLTEAVGTAEHLSAATDWMVKGSAHSTGRLVESTGQLVRRVNKRVDAAAAAAAAAVGVHVTKPIGEGLGKGWEVVGDVGDTVVSKVGEMSAPLVHQVGDKLH